MYSAIVTGGCGFIGSHLVRYLRQLGWRVIIVDNFEGNYMRNLRGSPDCVPLFPLDARKINKLPLLGHIDWFFHLAAHYANEKSLKEPVKSVEYNVSGTMACLDFCAKRGIKNFMYASSSGVYGQSKSGCYSETTLPQPSTPYEVGKYAGELLAKGHCDLYGMSLVAPRFFNVYGPGDIPGRWRSVVPNFFELAANKRPIQIYGDNSSREFTYIDDVIEGIYAAVKRVNLTAERQELVYNICHGEETKIIDLASEILKRCPPYIESPKIKPLREWDNAPRRYGDPALYYELFKHVQKTKLAQGLDLSFEWYYANAVKGGM